MYVTTSRALTNDGVIPVKLADNLLAGKLFPATQSGLKDPIAADDVPNATPPPDGRIASAGNRGAATLDEQSPDRWSTQDVRSQQPFDVTWTVSRPMPVRRWNYFITADGWDPAAPLSRDQFENLPFFYVENPAQPYWSYQKELEPGSQVLQSIRLPVRTGYHVLLAVCEIADSGYAFYQVIDLNFA